ncbi:MAG TPA: AAA family ATPase, partial [Acidimicrobiales bacterium]|nr:AAA family ATPase [Acidimicrobiales bacterium]
LSETVPANEAIGLLKRWHVTWARLADEVGVHLDNVANLDRVMRLPGTANHKGPNPVPVTVRARWTDSHQLGDVVELLDDLPVETAHSRAFTGHLAGSQFNEHIAAGTVLQSLRWTAVRLDPSGDEHWHHPGSANDISATVYADDGHCTIWSETVAAQTGVPTRRPLDPFGLWTWLVHSGDFVAAHAAIGERYGFKDLGLDLDDLDATPDPVTVPRRQPGRLIALTVGKVRPVKVKWLWDGWLPAGKLVALDGDPDTGKSTVSLDLAARVTKGAAMPDGSSGPSSAAVVLLSGEDDLDDTIVWRLMAAGADLDLVTHIQAVEGERGEAPFTIPGDLILLEELVGDVGAAMVVIDVLNEYLDSRVDSHKDQDIRRTLHRLKDVAARTKAAILMLRHLRKESSAKVIYRGGGSIGIVGAARAGWTVAYHPDDEALRVLAPVKMNLTVRPRPLGFKLLPHVEYPCAYVDWRGPVDIGANELLDPPPRPDPDEASALGFASQAIRELLGDGQEMWSKPFNDALNELGVSVRTRARARERLNVQVRQIRKPDKNGEMGWKLWMPRAND